MPVSNPVTKRGRYPGPSTRVVSLVPVVRRIEVDPSDAVGKGVEESVVGAEADAPHTDAEKLHLLEPDRRALGQAAA